MLSALVTDIANAKDLVELFAYVGPLDRIVTTATTRDWVYDLLPELPLPAIPGRWARYFWRSTAHQASTLKPSTLRLSTISSTYSRQKRRSLPC